MNGLAGKVGLVTGAARGQGEAIARALVAAGADVVMTDVLHDLGEQVAAHLGRGATYHHLDVTDPLAWSSLVEETECILGGIDVLVGNAGISALAPLVDHPIELFDRILDVNYRGIFLGMRAVAPSMLRRGAGSIINTGSIDGILGCTGQTAYVASKFAVRGMTRCAALELAPTIRVHAMCPGGVGTPIARDGVPPDWDWDWDWDGFLVTDGGQIAGHQLFPTR